MLTLILLSIALLPRSGLGQQGLRQFLGGQTYPLHGQTGYYGYWHPAHARATLHLLNPVVAPGEDLKLNVIFQNLYGDNDVFFNPTFNGLLPLPGVLAVYDMHRHYLGDLLQWIGGSRRGFEPTDWTTIGEDNIVGTRLRWTRLDSPGTYYLQMIYTHLFIATQDEIFGKVHQAPDEQGHIPALNDELLRSNIVTVHVVKDRIAAPPEY